MEQIIHEHLKSVYNFAYRLLGNREDAEDLTQEVFIKVWKNLHRYNPEKNFKTWLFAIARNAVIDKWRKKKELILAEDFEVVDDLPLPEELFLQKENKQELDQAIAKLIPHHQLIVVLHGLEDLTFEEISQIVGKPLNTVKSQYRRALHQIKEFLRKP